MARILVAYHAGEMAPDVASVADARRAFVRWAELAGPAALCVVRRHPFLSLGGTLQISDPV